MASSISVGTTASSLSDMPIEPDAITWGLMDISSPDAGRTQDKNVTMHKMRTAQKRKLSVSWTNPTFAQASQIVQAFNPEYVYVRYKDLLVGGWRTAKFYTGDKNSPFRQISLSDPDGGKTVMSTLSFDLIEV